MTDLLRIDNDGPRILGSNFWGSEVERAGKLYVSLHAGAFRLLVPASYERFMLEMATGRGVAVSRGPWPAMRLADAFEVLWDDGTSDAFALHLSPESFDRLPAPGDVAGEWVFSAWTRPRGGDRPRLALARPCRYRLSQRLPDLRPWQQP
jgi:hypothetical protein